ncbi:MAG: Ig-like domain-containing protein [Gemmatimonadaceae bacterium]
MRPPQRSYRIIAPVLFGLQALLLVSCESSSLLDPLSPDGLTANAQHNGRQTASITLSAPDSSLTPGQQVQASAEVKDQRGNVIHNAIVAWAADAQDVANVSTTGLVTGGSTMGTTTISATADGVTQTMTVSSVPAAAAGDTTSDPAAGDTTTAKPDSATTTPLGPAVHMVSITANATTLKIGEVTQVSGIVRDINGTPIPDVPITWSTSPTTVATVASTSPSAGLVTAKGVGTATLYAKADTAVRSIVITVVDSASTTSSTSPVPTGASGASYGSATPAELPRLSVNTAYPSPARQTRVPAGADLQAAIDAAQPGDELLLAPGASYVGNFYLRSKGSTSSWITIRTDLSDGAIGAPGTRMTPSRAASANLAKIVTPNIYSAITTEISANHYRFTGVEIAATSSTPWINTIVRFGDNTTAQNSAATTANNLILDRTYIHGLPQLSSRRCIMMNSASTAVVDSWVSECHSNDGDSQAIIGWNGPGPYLIQNNHLEAGHEVIMFGGGGVTTQNVSPSDITVRGNHIMRPTSWKGVWQVKNLIESKHARRLLIEGNVIENTWSDAQVGFALVLKSENQDGDTPWTQTTDVTVRYNRIRNVGSGFNIAANPSGLPAVPAARFVITDNVMENVGTSTYTGDGRLIQFLGGVSDVVTMHNTMVGAYGGNSASIYFGALPTLPRLVVHSNVFAHGNSGIKGDSFSEGTATLNTYTSGSLVTNNAIADGGEAGMYPSNNYFPSTLGSVGFVDVNSGNYRLSASSSYLGKGYDGRDIGADMNQVDAMTRNAVVAP